MNPAPALGGFLDFIGKGTEFLHLLGEVGERLEGRIKCIDLLLRVTCSAELLNQALVGILSGLLENNRIALFCRNLEVPIGLELLLGSLEPFLEPGHIKDRGNKD